MSNSLTWANVEAPVNTWQLGSVAEFKDGPRLIHLLAEVHECRDGRWEWAALPTWKHFERALQAKTLHWNVADTIEAAKEAAQTHLEQSGAITPKAQP